MDVKFFLQSKTIQGLLVMALALILPKLGVDLGDADLEQLAQYLLGAAGLVWAGYGRVTATAKLAALPRLGDKATTGSGQDGSAMPGVLIVLALSAMLVSISACAAFQGKSMDAKARIVGQQMTTIYVELHGRYQEVEAGLERAGLASALETLRPVGRALDETKVWLARYNDLALIWSATPDSDAPEELASLESRILETLNLASLTLAELAQELLEADHG